MAVVGDVYKVRVISTLGNQTAYNVSYWRVTAIVGTTPSDTLLANAFGVLFESRHKALMTNAAQFWGVGSQKVLPTPVGVETFSITSAGPGTAGTKQIAKQLCGFFNLKTALAGRRQRGRKYIPFADAADEAATDSVPSAGYMTRLGTLAAVYIGSPTLGTAPFQAQFEPVIFHRSSQTVDLILTATSKTKWATQRRRGDFGRPNPPPF